MARQSQNHEAHVRQRALPPGDVAAPTHAVLGGQHLLVPTGGRLGSTLAPTADRPQKEHRLRGGLQNARPVSAVHNRTELPELHGGAQSHIRRALHFVEAVQVPGSDGLGTNLGERRISRQILANQK